MGSQKEKVEFMFDTGSATTWVYSSNCTLCPDRPTFDEDKSESFKVVNEKLHVLAYGLGTVIGDLVQDSVCLAPDDSDLCNANTQFLGVWMGVDMDNY